MSAPGAGLYLHVPFCSRVCPYCDFAVRTGDRERRRRFVRHLVAEIELYSGHPLRFDTIYFGGGTPSLLEPDDLAAVLDALRCHLAIDAGCRIFLEANPEDVTDTTLAHWRGLGVGTLSLGVQSLDPAALEFLGRRHTVDEGRRSVERSLAAGFDTVSVDLIYGRPGQEAADWRGELERAVALGAHHLSCYQLTIHEGTRFFLLEKRGRLEQLPTARQAELFRLTHRFLNDAGMQGYEVSQFAAAPGHRSRHNLKYWDHTPYLGLGPSAHSFHEDRRWWNVRRTDPWQDLVRKRRRPVEGEESLGVDALVLEALMTGLRTYAGVDLARVRARWGVDLLAGNAALADRFAADGLLEVRGERLVPTLGGLGVADSLAAAFRIEAARS